MVTDTKIIKQMEDIFTEAGIQNYCDYILKSPKTSEAYYGIYKHDNKREMYFRHIIAKDLLEAITRKNYLLEKIKSNYKIEGFGDTNNNIA